MEQFCPGTVTKYRQLCFLKDLFDLSHLTATFLILQLISFDSLTQLKVLWNIENFLYFMTQSCVGVTRGGIGLTWPTCISKEMVIFSYYDTVQANAQQ